MKMHSRLLLFVAALLLSGNALAESWILGAAEWSRPRSGERVRAMPAVNAAMRAWQAEEDAQLVLRHASGEEGGLWASELKDWLVALGIPAGRIEVVPGGNPGELELEVLAP